MLELWTYPDIQTRRAASKKVDPGKFEMNTADMKGSAKRNIWYEAVDFYFQVKAGVKVMKKEIKGTESIIYLLIFISES